VGLWKSYWILLLSSSSSLSHRQRRWPQTQTHAEVNEYIAAAARVEEHILERHISVTYACEAVIGRNRNKK